MVRDMANMAVEDTEESRMRQEFDKQTDGLDLGLWETEMEPTVGEESFSSLVEGANPEGMPKVIVNVLGRDSQERKRRTDISAWFKPERLLEQNRYQRELLNEERQRRVKVLQTKWRARRRQPEASKKEAPGIGAGIVSARQNFIDPNLVPELKENTEMEKSPIKWLISKFEEIIKAEKGNKFEENEMK